MHLQPFSLYFLLILLPAFSYTDVFVFYFEGLLALSFPFPIFLSSVCRFICSLYRSLLVRHMSHEADGMWLSGLHLGPKHSFTSLTAVNTGPFKIKKLQQLVYFVALSGTCIDFPQEYFVVIAVIAIFYIVQRKLFDKWFTT